MFEPLVSHFLLSLSLGTATFSWIADPKLTGAGFIRLVSGHGFIFFFLLCAVWIGWESPEPTALLLEAFVLINLALQWRLQPDRRTWWTWGVFAVQVLLTFVLFDVGSFSEKSLFLLSSALFLGLTHYAMLLGHYYLVVPKLTERPLLVCLRIFWAFLFGKLVWSGLSTWGAEPYLVEGTALGDGYTFNWLVITMRWLWGYGALGALSWFAWKLCRMRSIQSATGVLYIMVFFVFIGELLSAYLFFKHGLKI